MTSSLTQRTPVPCLRRVWLHRGGTQDEIQGLFTELCGRLDALSNFNFTPKPVVPDMAVRANAPAITMEEVIPTAVSDAHLRAPEEVYRKKRGREGVVVGDDELSKEEKKRRRRVSARVKHALLCTAGMRSVWLLPCGCFRVVACVGRMRTSRAAPLTHRAGLATPAVTARPARHPRPSVTAPTRRRASWWLSSTLAWATSTPRRRC